jgi:hypothetical protein
VTGHSHPRVRFPPVISYTTQPVKVGERCISNGVTAAGLRSGSYANPDVTTTRGHVLPNRRPIKKIELQRQRSLSAADQLIDASVPRNWP